MNAHYRFLHRVLDEALRFEARRPLALRIRHLRQFEGPQERIGLADRAHAAALRSSQLRNGILDEGRDVLGFRDGPAARRTGGNLSDCHGADPRTLSEALGLTHAYARRPNIDSERKRGPAHPSAPRRATAAKPASRYGPKRISSLRFPRRVRSTNPAYAPPRTNAMPSASNAI